MFFCSALAVIQLLHATSATLVFIFCYKCFSCDDMFFNK